ncbi:MAG: sulfurtransferase [Burkholderiales bacterium]|jgi:thiosulfate/3-mercaptopyruvate sulfurtransferase|nr:sulfurtransferase [Burkholderiales bacterium]
MHDTLIDPATLASRLGDPGWVVLDARHDLAHPVDWGRGEYRKGHVPGAVFVHLDTDLSAPKNGSNGRHPLPAPDVAAALFGRCGIGAATQVVCYDQDSGMIASRAWWMLRWLGHRAVAVLDGGYARWVREGRRVSTDVPSPKPRALPVGALLPTANAGEVRASLEARAFAIVDARAPERFRGEVEPLDPVAGHIPGARNRPFGRNLGPDGTFRSAAALKADYEEFLRDVPTNRVVHQCGSGVSACHNILAMAVAGYPVTRLYPGSWSEWVADRSRPVATGQA